MLHERILQIYSFGTIIILSRVPPPLAIDVFGWFVTIKKNLKKWTAQKNDVLTIFIYTYLKFIKIQLLHGTCAW